MYGVSHQKAGLNWAGRFRKWSRERALADLVARVRRVEQTGAVHCGFQIADCGLNGKGGHEKWRRITGITVSAVVVTRGAAVVITDCDA
jgi:hypothetical protein